MKCVKIRELAIPKYKKDWLGKTLISIFCSASYFITSVAF